MTFNHISLTSHQPSSDVGSAPPPPESGTQSKQVPDAVDVAVTPPEGRNFPLGVRGLGLVAAGPQPQPGWVRREGSRLRCPQEIIQTGTAWSFTSEICWKEKNAGLGKTHPPHCFKHTACVRINYEIPFGNSAASRSLGWFPYMIYCIFIFTKGTEHSTHLTHRVLVTWWLGLSRARVLWAACTGAALQRVLLYTGHGTAHPEQHSPLSSAVNICYSAYVP